jgi:glycosyltransferase involved in cell wall biosynthesis
VLPAWLEDQPRRLLQAVANGVPVIAADACGLDGISGVTTMPAGDVEILRRIVAQVMNDRQAVIRAATRSSLAS